MAKNAGVYAIWAQYGATHASDDYERLVRITHWTKEDVDRESKLKELAEGIKADAVLIDNFKEIVGILNILK